jgi:hypothetical protein
MGGVLMVLLAAPESGALGLRLLAAIIAGACLALIARRLLQPVAEKGAGTENRLFVRQWR